MPAIAGAAWQSDPFPAATLSCHGKGTCRCRFAFLPQPHRSANLFLWQRSSSTWSRSHPPRKRIPRIGAGGGSFRVVMVCENDAGIKILFATGTIPASQEIPVCIREIFGYNRQATGLIAFFSQVTGSLTLIFFTGLFSNCSSNVTVRKGAGICCH